MLPKKTIDNLNALHRDFWWQKNKYNKGIYIKSWDSMCVSKDNGGLGIKNPHKFNLSLLTKITWRLIENPDKLWSIILKNKYFPKCDPLDYKKKTIKSWVWTSICEGIDVIRENHGWELGNGKNINMWSDKWLPNGKSPKPRNIGDIGLV